MENGQTLKSRMWRTHEGITCVQFFEDLAGPGQVCPWKILAKSGTKLPDRTIDIDKLKIWVAVVDEEHDLNPNTWSSGQGELVQTYVS